MGRTEGEEDRTEEAKAHTAVGRRGAGELLPGTSSELCRAAGCSDQKTPLFLEAGKDLTDGCLPGGPDLAMLNVPR